MPRRRRLDAGGAALPFVLAALADADADAACSSSEPPEDTASVSSGIASLSPIPPAPSPDESSSASIACRAASSTRGRARGTATPVRRVTCDGTSIMAMAVGTSWSKHHHVVTTSRVVMLARAWAAPTRDDTLQHVTPDTARKYLIGNRRYPLPQSYFRKATVRPRCLQQQLAAGGALDLLAVSFCEEVRFGVLPGVRFRQVKRVGTFWVAH